MKTIQIIAAVGLIVATMTCKKSVISHAIPEPKVIYRQGRSVIDGKPFLVKGIYAVNPPQFALAASFGFNVVQSYQFAGMTDDQVADYLNAAKDNGLRVLFHLAAAVPTQEVVTKVKTRVQRFKDHPAMYAWYLADEPSINKTRPEDLIALYQWINSTDRDHPVFSSNWELPAFKAACDADMPQFYFGPPSGQYNGALPKAKDRHETLGVSWIAIANTHDTKGFGADPTLEGLSPAQFTGTDAEKKQRVDAINANLENPPFPSLSTYPDNPIKVRGQALDMIAHGSNGIFYWLFSTPNVPMHPVYGWYTIFHRAALREALKNVLKEMDTVWPRIANPVVGATTWYEGSTKVFYWYRRDGNKATIMAVNESEIDQQVKTTLTDLKNSAELTASLSVENRTVKIVNGILDDKFRANEAHVYLVDLK